MSDFAFEGEIPGSKSIFNRALIVQSYFSSLKITGDSQCDDVRFMRAGLQDLKNQSNVNCGEGGTTFRFMALRASRLVGEYCLFAKPRLLQRPQKGLLNVLNQLGVLTVIDSEKLVLKGNGWKQPVKNIIVDTSESSQYASALLLNAWLLDFDLEFELQGDQLSQSYFLLTLEMVRSLGMKVTKTDRGYLIPAGQTIDQEAWAIEPDLSSTFSIAAAGALSGIAKITNFPFASAQPDLQFLKIFEEMKVRSLKSESALTVERSSLRAIQVHLSQCPDLFPVLAVLCSWAEGVSSLRGAPHLALKESDRIAKISELLKLVKVEHRVFADGIEIHGNPNQELIKDVSFNPDQDHRMVMAAALMRLKGHQIKIEDSKSINKSFPEFWQMIGLPA